MMLIELATPRPRNIVNAIGKRAIEQGKKPGISSRGMTAPSSHTPNAAARHGQRESSLDSHVLVTSSDDPSQERGQARDEQVAELLAR